MIFIVIIDIFLISILFSILMYSYLKFNRRNILISKKDLAIVILVIILSILIIAIGVKLNFKIVDVYKGYMPIDKSIALKYLSDPERVSELNDARHIVIENNDIKKHFLCDRFYIKRIVFSKNVFYSIGDTIAFIGGILLFTSIFAIILCRKRIKFMK